MRLIVALFVIVGLLGFAGFTQAADPKTGPTAPHKGIFEKVDKADGKQSIYYKGGAKGTGQDWYLAVDDKATVTIDGKDGKLADLKAGQVLTFTVTKEHLITKVVAETPKDAPPASGK